MIRKAKLLGIFWTTAALVLGLAPAQALADAIPPPPVDFCQQQAYYPYYADLKQDAKFCFVNAAGIPIYPAALNVSRVVQLSFVAKPTNPGSETDISYSTSNPGHPSVASTTPNGGPGSAASASSSDSPPPQDYCGSGGVSCNGAHARAGWPDNYYSGNDWSGYAAWTNFVPDSYNSGDDYYNALLVKNAATSFQWDRRIMVVWDGTQSDSNTHISDWSPYTTQNMNDGQTFTGTVALGPASVTTSFQNASGQLGGRVSNNGRTYGAAWGYGSCPPSNVTIGTEAVDTYDTAVGQPTNVSLASGAEIYQGYPGC